jgi:transcriptional regulator with XRE-family HTH domain
MATNKEIGKKIYNARSLKQFSQAGLASKTHISQTRISDIEHGLKSPTWDEIESITKELNEPITAILPDYVGQTFNGNNNSTGQIYQGNINLQLPVDNVVQMIKDLVSKELKK